MIPLHQLPLARWRKIMREEPTVKDVDTYLNWRAWQDAELKRQRWIYGFVTATVLALIGFLVAGGCR